MITRPIGIRGELRVLPYTSEPAVLLTFRDFFMYDGALVKFPISCKRVDGKGCVVATAEGCTSRNDAELLRMRKLYVSRGELPGLADNEYYLSDLKGLSVFDDSRGKIGSVVAALDYGAGAFLEICLEGRRNVATLPFGKDSVRDVNLDRRTICVNKDFLLV
jgi:16S rRNA processing protein RimM